MALSYRRGGKHKAEWDSDVYAYKNLAILLTIPVMVLAKLIVAYGLPPKYFYDNNRILGMVTGGGTMQAWEGSYRVASDLFSSLDVFHFQTMLDWSLTLGVIGTGLLMLFMLRMPQIDLLQMLFYLASVGLLNIYVFNIGKDVIQFAFFLAAFIVLLLPIDKVIIKIALIAGILWYESTFFRSYYVLIAALFIGVYVVLTVFRKLTDSFSALTGIAIIVTLFVMVYVMMLVVERVMPDEYHQVLTVRESQTQGRGDGADSATVILNLLPGSGLPGFMWNYVLNALRMMFPIELALKGVYYLPFFVFQALVAFYVVNLLRSINSIRDETDVLALCVYVGYALASFIFEPDFGSWVRHEAATFPILHLLIFSKNQQLSVIFASLKRIDQGRVDRGMKSAGKERSVAVFSLRRTQ